MKKSNFFQFHNVSGGTRNKGDGNSTLICNYFDKDVAIMAFLIH